MSAPGPSSTDPLLFTPGPLTTSLTVKQAMLHDAGSRDRRFIALVRDTRTRLLNLAGVSQADGYEAVLMQGSGTFGVEAALGTLVPQSGKLLILINGAYGERMQHIAAKLNLPHSVLRWPENEVPQPSALEAALQQDPAITHIATVHCETTTGILNPIEDLARVTRAAGRRLIIDAMSSFGGIPLHLGELGADCMISSANKCIEGVPGFAFALTRRESLLASKGQARSLSLDLAAQWEGLERTGQFRFTPPTHALLAFHQALRELDQEGGVPGRHARYQANHRALMDGMTALGFRPYLPPTLRGCIITAFHYPTDPKFDFEDFYHRLADRGMVIYPGKLSQVDCFRIGSIGRLSPADLQALVKVIQEELTKMGLSLTS